jgi:site-specific recombinase
LARSEAVRYQASFMFARVVNCTAATRSAALSLATLAAENKD